MKKILIPIVMYVMIFFSFLSLTAQDKPDGFASVSGEGLITTTGGEGGAVVHVYTLSDLEKYAASANPYIIIVNGYIQSTNWTEVNVASNKTIVGYGSDATLKNIELNLNNVSNVIIRNLIIRDSYVEGDYDGKTNDNDAIQADNSHHIWIDHCHFTHCGDGLIDLRFACDYVTVSWVHLSNHNKTFGIGWTDETDWRLTIHHCWFDSTRTRNPSFDQGIGHLYNNYLNDNEAYGNLARGNARLVIQNSYFYKVNIPLNISDNGILYSSGNQFQSCTGNKSGNVSEMPFDPKSYYDYSLDTTSQVKTIVISGSGPHAYIGNQYLGINEKSYLSVSVADGNGSVAPDSADYDAGQYVTVTATPDIGWQFDGWNIEQFGNTNPVTIVATDSINLLAYFSLVQYRLATSVAEGEGSVNPKTSSYEYGQQVTITATATEGYIFDHWEGDLSGNTNPETITVLEDMNITAHFIKDPTATKLDEKNDENSITYYFNPVHKTLYIQAYQSNLLSVSIISLDGKLILSEEFNQPGEMEISLNGINKGLYLVRFKIDEKIKTGQIVLF